MAKEHQPTPELKEAAEYFASITPPRQKQKWIQRGLKAPRPRRITSANGGYALL